MNIVLYTAMHGRQKTVKTCLEYLIRVKSELVKYDINLELIYGYTDPQDGQMLSKYPVLTYRALNNPLWMKFDGGMDVLKGLDYDVVCMFGSDDIADVEYFRKIKQWSLVYGYIGFQDIYFYNRISGERHYWPGYVGPREGEPAGAGKAYAREVMELIDYKLFQPSNDRGLDKGCHEIMKERNIKCKLLSVLDGPFICDVKDGQGLTPTSRFINLLPSNFVIPEY